MQDPSHGVAQPLQNHVHLISGHRFPLQPSLNLEQAFRYLLDAPTIVKQTAPMAWEYISVPADGRVWLEWIPNRNGEYRFASDGYVWLDPEQAYRQEFGGYTIEWATHTVGFRPQMDQYASHSRTRYHFVSKNPSVNAAPPDPSLWIVHYHQADQNRMIPVNAAPINVQMRQTMNERRWLEAQGELGRKDFMLHDREHWPTIQVPRSAGQMAQMQQQGMYGNPMAQQQMQQQRFPQYGGYPQSQGGPPAKRPRHSGGMTGVSDGVHDISIGAEEDTTGGDFFDHLTPREISIARYMQHHRWMEEVFSSPYASHQIVPPDLGLGLMGELKGLTEGLLDPPSLDGEAVDKSGKPKEVERFTNLKKEHVDEFNRRVEKHLEEGQAEIERMKKEHAEKMAEWKKTKTLMQAEKRLRNATWNGHEDAMPVYRLDVAATNGHIDDSEPPEHVDDIVKDVEKVLGVRINGYKDATMIQKGGLEKEEEQPKDATAQEVAIQPEPETMDVRSEQPAMSGINGGVTQAQKALDHQPGVGNAETVAEALQPSAPPDVPQPSFEPAPPMQGQNDQNHGTNQGLQTGDSQDRDDMDEMEGVDMGDTSLLEGEDMSAGHEGMDFVNQPSAVSGDNGLDPADDFGLPEPLEDEIDEGDGGIDVGPDDGDDMFGESARLTDAIPVALPQQDALPMTTAEAAVAEAVAEAPAVSQPEFGAPVEPSGVAGEDPGVGDVADNNLFDDGTFDDLGNVGGDDNGDAGLIDFDGGDFGGGGGMDESAFGDALHGMEMPEGGDAGGEAAQQQS